MVGALIDFALDGIGANARPFVWLQIERQVGETIMRYIAIGYVSTVCLLVALWTLPAFGSQSSLRIAFSSHSENNSGIHVAGVDEGTTERLTKSRFDILPQWSPNGRTIGFMAIRPADQEIAGQYDLSSHWFLYTVAAKGGKPTRVSSTPISLFKWSPDGTQVLFQSSYEDTKNRQRDGLVSSAVYVMDADGNNQRRLTPVDGTDHFPVWSPSGDHIAFCSDRFGNLDLFVVQRDGRQLRRFTEDVTAQLDPIWSPNSDAIAFASFDDGRPLGTYVVDLNEKSRARRVSKGRPLAWFPDSKQLLIRSKDDLFIVGVNSDKHTGVTDEADEVVGEVALSPDGRNVIYEVQRDENAIVYCLDLTTNVRQPMCRIPGGISGLDVLSHQIDQE